MSDPRISFTEICQLQDLLESQAKKLTLNLNIEQLNSTFIHDLGAILQTFRGDLPVSFDVMELEQITPEEKTAVTAVVPELVAATMGDENDDDESLIFEDITEDGEVETELNFVESMEAVETVKIVTSLPMPSRFLKVKICEPLLAALEKEDIKYKLN